MQTVIPVEAQTVTPVPSLKFDALLGTHDLFRRSWEHQRSDLTDVSLSGYDLSLASIAIHAKWTDEEISALIFVHRKRYGGPDDIAKGKHAGYIARTIKTAREKTEGSTITVKDDEGRDIKVDALELARKKLWLPSLRRVIQYGTEKPVFYLELLDGRRIKVGTTNQIRLNSVATLDAVAIEIGDTPPPYSPTKWHPVARALLALRVVEETGSSDAQETRAWIASTAKEGMEAPKGENAYDLGDDDHAREVAEKSRKVFTATDGHLYLRAEAVEKYIRTILKISRSEVSKQDLCARFKDIGFTRTPLYPKRDENGNRPERVYWRSPDGFDWKAPQ